MHFKFSVQIDRGEYEHDRLIPSGVCSGSRVISAIFVLFSHTL